MRKQRADKQHADGRHHCDLDDNAPGEGTRLLAFIRDVQRPRERSESAAAYA